MQEGVFLLMMVAAVHAGAILVGRRANAPPPTPVTMSAKPVPLTQTWGSTTWTATVQAVGVSSTAFIATGTTNGIWLSAEGH